MKLSRNVLVGSLATAGMVLGAVAPALTAQAATSTGKITDSGAFEYQDPTEVGSLTDSNSKLAIAYDGSLDEPAGKSGVATAKSNAHVNVVSGVLVLNEVPDFNFGTAVSGQTKNLVDNTKDIDDMSDKTATDGNASGNLSVLESRDTTKAAGFDLSAQLGDFTTKDGTAAGNTDPFVLHLNAQPVTDGQKAIDNGTKGALTTEAVDLNSAAAKASSVMTIAKGDAGYVPGEYLANFGQAEAGKDATATLKIPDGVGDASKKEVKSLNSTITWTLSAAPTVA